MGSQRFLVNLGAQLDLYVMFFLKFSLDSIEWLLPYSNHMLECFIIESKTTKPLHIYIGRSCITNKNLQKIIQSFQFVSNIQVVIQILDVEQFQFSRISILGKGENHFRSSLPPLSSA